MAIKAPKTVGTAAPVKTVAGTEAPAAAAAVVVKKGGPGMVARIPFDFTTAVNAEGVACYDEANKKLTDIPANFDHRKHKPLAKTDFANEGTYWLLKADISQKFANTYLESAAKYRTIGERVAKYGNAEDRKRVSKLERIRKEFLALQAALAADGITDIPALSEETAAA